MGEWKEYELGEVCSRLNSGKNIPGKMIFNTGTFPVYGGNGLRGYTNIYNFDGDCAIIGRQGAYCGNVRYFKGTAYMTEHAVVVCANENNNTRYLSYLLSTQNLGRLSGQSAQPGLSVKTLAKQIIKVPALSVQNKIVALLSSFDDKIALNNYINKNLEEQAQEIYHYLFIENFNRSWEIGSLTDLITIKYGKDHKKMDDGIYPVYGSGGIMRYVAYPLYDKESVLIPRKGSLNNVMYVKDPFWSVDTMFYTIMKQQNIAKFVFHFLKGINLESLNAGSAVPSMTTSILNAIELRMPDDKTLEKFERIVAPIYDLKLFNQAENRNLANLRDTLLPRLMSGELDVSTVRI